MRNVMLKLIKYITNYGRDFIASLR